MEAAAESEIRKAEFFRALSPDRLARIEPLLRERRFKRHQVLYFEGAACERLWVVRSGEIRLYKASQNGHITALDVLRAGEIFGAVSPSEQERYTSSAEALSEGSAWWMPASSAQRLIEAEPRLAVEILGVVSRRLREAHERLRSFAQDPAPARLARALLRAAPDGEAHVTRRDLAEAAGTTVETAIRVLRRMERAGILHGEVGRVQVLDRAALRALANGGTPR